MLDKGIQKTLENKNIGTGQLTRSLCLCLDTQSRQENKRVFGTLPPFLHPSMTRSGEKEETGRAEGGEREGMGDSSINAK